MAPLLDLKNVMLSFGGLQVTNNVSLYVNPGELVSIIGPNGAGKTTLFNQITGRYKPESGSITFDGQSLISKSPDDVVRMGIGRAFQRSNIFPRLTVFENVQAAVLSYHQQELKLWQPRSQMTKYNDRVAEILYNIGLHRSHNVRAAELALGDQKRLEIGLALALEPKLLLLDEPTAGMSQEETNNTVALIDKLVRELDMTLLFTEHDIGLVFNISQRIYVLNMGTIIAEGTPQEVADNPDVQRVYLGTDHAEIKKMKES
jgi:branched-chain amino acid transport system ATP-binding protein